MIHINDNTPPLAQKLVNLCARSLHSQLPDLR
jgi:hypothetical protein